MIDPGASPRARLNRDRVLQVAVALADARRHRVADHAQARRGARRGGDVAVQPRREQGRPARRHDRHRVRRDRPVPPSEADWRTAMRRRAISAREVLARHRWATGLMESRTTPGPANLRHHDTVLGMLRGRGFLDRAGRARLFGAGQLHLRVRPAGAEPAVRQRRGDREGRAGDHGPDSPPASTRTSPRSPSSTSCNPGTTTATSSPSGSS